MKLLPRIEHLCPLKYNIVFLFSKYLYLGMLFRNDPLNEEAPKKKKRAVVLAESPFIQDGVRNDAFIQEGENVRKFYADNPDVQVDVLPFYGQEEFKSIQSQLGQLGDQDEVYVFGHGGSKIGGIPHDQVAGALKESGAKNCYMGSCRFEDYAEPYKDMQNFNYRPNSDWWGFNPQAKTPVEGMFSRATKQNDSPVDFYSAPRVQEAEIVQPKQGVHYNRIFNRPKAEAIPNRIMRKFL